MSSVRTVHYTQTRSAPGSSIVLQISDQRDVGRVIGRGGATIKQLQRDTGARIQVKDDAVTISGDAQAVMDASFMVQRIIGGPNVRVLRDLDEATIGYLSNAEEWLNALMEKFNVGIEIGRRDVILEANDDNLPALEEVQQAIQQRLQEQLEQVTESVPVGDLSKLPEIFKDPVIVSLREMGSLTVDIVKSDVGTTVDLTGPGITVEEAKEAVNRLLANEQSSAIVHIVPGLLLQADEAQGQDFADDLVDAVERRYKCIVQYTWGGNRIDVRIDPNQGVLDDLPLAVRCIQELLIYYYPENCAMFYIRPLLAVDYVCGKDETELVRFQSRDCVISFNRRDATIWICGEPRLAEMACNRFEQSLATWNAGHRLVPLPNDGRVKGWIVGPGGENLRRLQMESGASITIEENVVLVGGQKEEMEKAVSGLKSVIQAWEQRQSAYQQSPQQYSYPPTPRRGRGNRGGRGYRPSSDRFN